MIDRCEFNEYLVSGAFGHQPFIQWLRSDSLVRHIRSGKRADMYRPVGQLFSYKRNAQVSLAREAIAKLHLSKQRMQAQIQSGLYYGLFANDSPLQADPQTPVMEELYISGKRQDDTAVPPTVDKGTPRTILNSPANWNPISTHIQKFTPDPSRRTQENPKPTFQYRVQKRRSSRLLAKKIDYNEDLTTPPVSPGAELVDDDEEDLQPSVTSTGESTAFTLLEFPSVGDSRPDLSTSKAATLSYDQANLFKSINQPLKLHRTSLSESDSSLSEAVDVSTPSRRVSPTRSPKKNYRLGSPYPRLSPPARPTIVIPETVISPATSDAGSSKSVISADLRTHIRERETRFGASVSPTDRQNIPGATASGSAASATSPQQEGISKYLSPSVYTFPPATPQVVSAARLEAAQLYSPATVRILQGGMPPRAVGVDTAGGAEGHVATEPSSFPVRHRYGQPSPSPIRTGSTAPNPEHYLEPLQQHGYGPSNLYPAYDPVASHQTQPYTQKSFEQMKFDSERQIHAGRLQQIRQDYSMMPQFMRYSPHDHPLVPTSSHVDVNSDTPQSRTASPYIHASLHETHSSFTNATEAPATTVSAFNSPRILSPAVPYLRPAPRPLQPSPVLSHASAIEFDQVPDLFPGTGY